MFEKKDKGLSDHIPFTIKNKNHLFLCWNMLNKMSIKETQWGPFLNNGFACKMENEDEYIARLEVIADKLLKFMKLKPSVICLQEGPSGTFYDKFKNQFESNPHYKFLHTPRGDHNLITLYNSEDYEFCSELTEKLKEVSLVGFKDRVLMAVLKKTQEEPILLINVHADFGKEIASDVKQIYHKACELKIQNIIFMGDFNRALLLPDPNDRCKNDISSAVECGKFIFENEALYVHAIPNSSFIRRLEVDLKVEIEKRDGVLSSESFDLEFKKDIFMTKDLKNKLSVDLQTLPENFKENLLKFDKNHEAELAKNVLYF